MNKEFLRKWAKKKRSELNIDFISSMLSDKLIQTNEYSNSKNIMIYYPLEYEVNLLSILEDKTKQFYLPRISNHNLECCPYNTGDELAESCFHTKEPVCNNCSKIIIDMVIIPALACDNNNYRLGYGGGYYDRFLTDYKGIKVICIPKELVVETIYPDKYDVKADLIITA